jgi:hypothetical protein
MCTYEYQIPKSRWFHKIKLQIWWRKCYTVPDLSLTGYAECFWPLQLQAEIEAGMGRRQMFGRAGSHLKYSKPKAMLKKDARWHHCTPTWSNSKSFASPDLWLCWPVCILVFPSSTFCAHKPRPNSCLGVGTKNPGKVKFGQAIN